MAEQVKLEDIRPMMLAIEKRADRDDGESQPVGEFLAEQLGIEWTPEFDETVVKETDRACELMKNYYSGAGVAMTVGNIIGIGIAQGITLALAVQALKDGEHAR
jgi:hypothetical protein